MCSVQPSKISAYIEFDIEDYTSKMPVDFDLSRDLEEWDWSSAGGGPEILEPPSEEFWKKFEELPDLGDDLETLFAEVRGLEPVSDLVVRNHDCMWRGVCHSKEYHKNDSPVSCSPPLSSIAKTAPAPTRPAAVKVVRTPEKKRTVVVQKCDPVEPVVRPDTPQSMGSESEEESLSTTQVVPARQITNQLLLSGQTTMSTIDFCHDHDYDIKKKSVVRPDDLGVQTPSDSEEEEEQSSRYEEECEEEEEEEVEEDEEETETESEDSEDEEIDVVSICNTRPTTLKPQTQGRTPRPLWRGGSSYTSSSSYIASGNTSTTSSGSGSPAHHQLPTNPNSQTRHQLQAVADSLLTASRAVSRRLQGSVNKRKRRASYSSRSSLNHGHGHSGHSNGGQTGSGGGRGRRRGLVPVAKKSRFSSSTSTTHLSPTTSSSSSTSGYLVDTEKRSLHNNMERMRRIELRNAFEDLRQLVPSIADSQKAAKVTILKDATHYVQELNLKDKNFTNHIDALRSEQERLRRTLSQLRRILASKNKTIAY